MVIGVETKARTPLLLPGEEMSVQDMRHAGEDRRKRMPREVDGEGQSGGIVGCCAVLEDEMTPREGANAQLVSHRF